MRSMANTVYCIDVSWVLSNVAGGWPLPNRTFALSPIPGGAAQKSDSSMSWLPSWSKSAITYWGRNAHAWIGPSTRVPC